MMVHYTPNEAALYWYHTDHLGTPQALTDRHGQIAWQAQYDPFGEVVLLVNSVTQPLRFPGQYFDEETGLHYNYFRDYDPGTGRHVQSDPIGLRGGLSTYGYAYQSPVMGIDPYGLWTWSGPRDVYNFWRETLGGAYDLYRGWNDMKDAGTIGADAYFHCRANCEASRRGPAGQDIACFLSSAREDWQREPLNERARDEAANLQGQRAGQLNPNVDCYKACESLIPPWGIPERHLPSHARPEHVYGR